MPKCHMVGVETDVGAQMLMSLDVREDGSSFPRILADQHLWVHPPYDVLRY